MKRLVMGILAHVDAGKTTLSEALLYKSGMIRNAGRVDNKDAFLDTYELEKKRGITIFSKQAQLSMEDVEFTLLDTPGHVDFSAEMERTLQVLDYAILLVSGADGVQGHTRTLWSLLEQYDVPTFIFFNKMDQPGTDKDKLLAQCKEKLSPNMVDFSRQKENDLISQEKLLLDPEFQESVAVCDETLLERVLEGGEVAQDEIVELIAERKLFPCFFGSALRMDGIEELLEDLKIYTAEPLYGENFGAKVYKISRDETGARLTFCKITGGSLKVKETLSGLIVDQNNSGLNDEETDDDQLSQWSEKVNQIRVYSGSKYESVSEALPGMICALTGLTQTHPGQGLGDEYATMEPTLEPVMTYQVILPEDVDAVPMLQKMRILEEEEPLLHVVWDEKLKEIRVQIMGEVQLEILKTLIKERFDVDVTFGCGHIVYKETIANIVEGVGHFEPLRHYAEVHLLMEPLENGSGIQVAADVSEDILDRNWQRLVLTHLEEREHRGVLTGSVITDMKLTLVAGKAHLKHTMGGDFRQATYRAIRQGLMQATSVLLEPFYRFTLELPEQMVGRAMTDLQRMAGSFDMPEIENGKAILKGRAPVATLQSYQSEVTAYSKGEGRLTLVVDGYGPCHNTEEVLAESTYDPDLDLRNPSGSVFCSHGAGVVIPWHEVPNYMHLESVLTGAKSDYVKDMMGEVDSYGQSVTRVSHSAPAVSEKAWVGTDEIDAILARTFHSNTKTKVGKRKWSYSKNKPSGAGKSSYYSGSGSYGSSNSGFGNGTAAGSGAGYGSGNSHGATGSRTLTYGDGKRLGGKETPGGYTEYFLVDGYNIIFAWQELKELAAMNIDSARDKLLDILCNYQSIRHCELIAVFDAYRVKGHGTEFFDFHNIHVVFTKEAETADQYIERFAHDHAKKYNVTVATSDGLEQVIIRGQGCRLMSAREFEKEVAEKGKMLKQFLEQRKLSGKEPGSRNFMMEAISDKARAELEAYLANYDA